jgi:hypothetical protein
MAARDSHSSGISRADGQGALAQGIAALRAQLVGLEHTGEHPAPTVHPGWVRARLAELEALLAAPALDGKAGGAAAIGQAVGKEGIGDLAAVTQSFRKLGLKGDAVKKAIPVLTDFVGKRSGGDLAKLLGESLR